MTPVVTVLMAVRNEERFVGQAVESILAQTVGDFELLVVNDASEDGTVEVLSQYQADRRLRVVNNPERLGQGRSLNRGLELAKSGLIARFDGNDVAHSDRLEAQLPEIQKRPSLAVIGSWYDVIDESGHAIGRTVRLPVGPDRIADAVLSLCPIAHVSAVYRKEVVRALGGYRGTPADDWFLWARVAEQAQLDNVPESLMRCRVQLRGISGSVESRARQRQEGREIMLEALCRRERGIGPVPTLPARAASHLAIGIEYLAEGDGPRACAQFARSSELGIPGGLAGDHVMVRLVERAVEVQQASWRVAINTGVPEEGGDFINGFYGCLVEQAADLSPSWQRRALAWLHIAIGLTDAQLTMSNRRRLVLWGARQDWRWLRNRGVLRTIMSR